MVSENIEATRAGEVAELVAVEGRGEDPRRAACQPGDPLAAQARIGVGVPRQGGNHLVPGSGQGLGDPKAGEGTGAGQEDPGHGQVGLKSGQVASRSDITRGSAGQSSPRAGSFQRTPSPFPGSKKRSIS